jgi:tetratricopeptide (TPR) repeat protein
MMDFFNALLAECPLVFVVDDFDQADETSLALLHIAFRRLINEPLLVLLTARTGRLSHSSVNKLRPHEAVNNVAAMTLEPLEEEASAQLYEALVAGMSQVPNTTERRVLLSAAGGFPLALEILLRDWQRSGMRAVPLAVRAMTGDVDVDPDSWSYQLASTLNTEFADPERLVVYLASVLDRRVGDLSLYAAAGVPQGTLLGAMSQLVEQRLLRDGPTGLEWINPTVRTQCYLLTPKALRKHFHEAVAAELLRQMAAGAAIPNLEIAWHCMRAGRHSEASRYIISGARQAIIQGAPHEAELALTSGMAVIDITNKEEATLVLVEALLELSRPSEAVSLLSRASLPTSKGSQTANFLMVRARDQLSKLAVHEKEAVVHQICQLLLGGEDPATGVLAAWTGSDLVEVFGQNHLATELLAASKAIDCSALQPPDLMRLRITQARLEYIPRRMHEAARLLKEALGIADAYNLRHSSYLQVLNGLGAMAAATGQYEQGLEASKKHYTESVKAGDNRRASIACGNLAVCCCRLGRYGEAIEWGQRAKEAHPSTTEPPLNAEESIGLSRAMLGDHNLALESVESIVQLAQRSTPPYLRKRMWLSAADVSMAIGDSRRATGMAREALSIPTEVTLDLGVAGILARWQSLIAIEDGRVEQTADEVRRLLQMPIDARDRAEVLASLKLLGCISIEEDALLTEALLTLPPALIDQFRRLGLILDRPALQPGRRRKRATLRRGAHSPSQITREARSAVTASQEEAAV